MTPLESLRPSTRQALRERIGGMPTMYENYLARDTRKTYLTEHELAFICAMADKGNVAVLRTMRAHVSTRRYDRGMDVAAITAALDDALERLDAPAPYDWKGQDELC